MLPGILHRIEYDCTIYQVRKAHGDALESNTKKAAAIMIVAFSEYMIYRRERVASVKGATKVDTRSREKKRRRVERHPSSPYLFMSTMR